jgi:hypothetical protein
MPVFVVPNKRAARRVDIQSKTLLPLATEGFRFDLNAHWQKLCFTKCSPEAHGVYCLAFVVPESHPFLSEVLSGRRVTRAHDLNYENPEPPGLIYEHR